MAKQAKTETAPESAKTPKVSDIQYVAGDTVSNTVNPDATVVRVTFGNGATEDVSLGDLSSEILHCATLQGLAIKLQRSFASAKGDPSEAHESFMTVKENLLSGLWNTKREGSGPRLSILVEAIVAALEEDGETVDEARQAAIGEKLKDDTKREGAMKNPAVKKHYERIKAARAAERAAKAAKEADESGASLTDF
jgi:hypothetical protein